MPDVSFVADDAGVDAPDATRRFDAGGSTPAPDAGHLDAGGAPDTGAGSTCPVAPPAGATLCCDTVPCSGLAQKCAPSCTNCENDCNTGRTCCLDKNGNFAGCYGTPSECP